MMPAYAHSFIDKLFFKEFDSNRVSCHFNTTAKRKCLFLTPVGSFDRTYFILRCALHKVRQLVIQGFGSVLFKNRRVTEALVSHTIFQ